MVFIHPINNSRPGKKGCSVWIQPAALLLLIIGRINIDQILLDDRLPVASMPSANRTVLAAFPTRAAPSQVPSQVIYYNGSAFPSGSMSEGVHETLPGVRAQSDGLVFRDRERIHF
jgi:hypothetical protein